VDPVLTTVGVAALTEGVKFLYAQATEVLKSWRAGRRGEPAAPAMVPAPEGVSVGPSAEPPLPAPRDALMEDTLLELRDMVDQVRDGTVDIASEPGRRMVADLRDYLEVVLRAPIRFAGEPARTLETGRVDVVARRVEGDVAGVRARGGVTGRIGDVSVDVDEVGETGRVTGVDLG
jgi:hypothetical protein